MNHCSNVSAYVSVYIYAQAFSASLKRSLNLSANKYYYYYYYYYAAFEDLYDPDVSRSCVSVSLPRFYILSVYILVNPSMILICLGCLV